jgi:tetratricopeptide (TPR) repeat protein
VFLEQLRRRIVPRWRDHRTTLALGELSQPRAPLAISESDSETLSLRASEWLANPTVWHAGDLISSAFAVGASDRFRDAVDFVLKRRDAAPRPLVGLAEKIVRPVGQRSVGNPEIALVNVVGRMVHDVRFRLRNEPRNAIQWVELARLYTLQGASNRAIRSMITAAALGPDNRFVIRSAARLFLHEHDAGRALRAIRNASGARTDPWLLAAEIAIASASQSPSLLAKVGRFRNEDSDLSEFERTELSSALATLELENGKSRKARQLFRQSLADPNENSVAQAEWANREIGGLDLRTNLNDVPRSYEAHAQLALRTGEWQLAIENGLLWLEDQPFSKGPVIFTSYVSSLVEDYERSIEILRSSLNVNQNDPMLRNNLAFALASANRLTEAEDVLRGTDYNSVSGVTAITLAATHGLVLFRKGFPDKGRELYRLAIDRASALGVLKYRIHADLYLAREELLANTSVARGEAEKALAAAEKSTEPDVVIIAGQVRRVYRQFMSSTATAASRHI